MSDHPSILLDCDPGHDDAFAILLAGVTTRLVAVTTVSGNVGLASTTRNANVVREVGGLDVPIYAGAARPLAGEPLHAPDIHGDSGLDGPVLPDPSRAIEESPAVEAILRLSREVNDLWLVPTGPLTNIAHALRVDPTLAERVAGISLMGGSRSFGNTTPAAEFNILADPEAAHVVFASGAPIVMAGLDLTHQFRLGWDEIAAFRALESRVGTFAADLLTFFMERYEARSGMPSAPMHDPCAVMAVTHPEWFDSERLNVRVERYGEYTRGMTLCDTREMHHRKDANATVLTRIDRDAAFQHLLDSLGSYGSAG